MGTAIVATFTDAMTDFATSIAQTVTTTFNTLFMSEAGSGLSNLAIYGLTFSGLALVIGIVRIFTRKAG